MLLHCRFIFLISFSNVDIFRSKSLSQYFRHLTFTSIPLRHVRQTPAPMSMRNFYCLLICAGLTFSCAQSKSSDSKLDSDELESKADRIEILKNEIKNFSDIKDAEFELFNVNGFHDQRISIPGASSWDYKFAVRVDTADAFKWRAEMTAVVLDNYDDSWTREIVKNRKQYWQTSCGPVYYMRPGENVTIIEFPEDGIIFARIITQ